MTVAAQHVAATQQDISDAVHVQLKLAGYEQTGASLNSSGSSSLSPSLSQAALNVILSLEGVSSVLVGMRRPEYVVDSFGALELPAVDAQGILSRFRGLQSE